MYDSVQSNNILRTRRQYTYFPTFKIWLHFVESFVSY